MSDQLEFHLPGGSIPPNPKTERMKMWINIVSTGAALAIAVAAAIRPPDGGMNEAVYKEMVVQVGAMHQENVRQHEDIMALRKYMEDYLRASSFVGPKERGISQPTPSNAPVILIPIDKSKIRMMPGPNSQPVLVLPAGEPPPLPDFHSFPDTPKITDFKAIVDRVTMEQAAKKK